MLFRSAPLALFSLLVISSPTALHADDDAGTSFDGGGFDSAPTEDAAVLTIDARADVPLVAFDAASSDVPAPSADGPLILDAAASVDSVSRADAGADARGDGGGATAPVKLLPDGGARGLVADNAGCSLGHGTGSSGSLGLALALGLAFIIARRRGRS